MFVFVLVRCWSFSALIYHIVLRLLVYFSLDFTHDLGPSLDLGRKNSHHFAVVQIRQWKSLTYRPIDEYWLSNQVSVR